MNLTEKEKELIKEVLELGADTFKRWSEECYFDHEPEKQEYFNKYIECKSLLAEIK